ncbi:hypothetical protein [Pseudomonas cedrina]|uniref:hypothetical protein n=1 Tax=Pseudomonas cedrina TaxID=651740 RepID=UPI0027807912|nr:hypothetical protein [Pseudomonas cedrina]MDQ0654577.1 hypothetical protein [Pseudomonas cedrina]
MQLRFKTLALLTAWLCFALALTWGVRPEWMLWLWSVEYSSATGLVARRNAALLLAIGVMFYRARHAPPSATRRAMTGGFIVGCLILAVLGFGEWINGNAGPGILLAMATETVLGLAFIQAHRSSVTQTQAST